MLVIYSTGVERTHLRICLVGHLSLMPSGTIDSSEVGSWNFFDRIINHLPGRNGLLSPILRV